MSKEKVVVQNEATPLESSIPEADGVCREIAYDVFRRVMDWHPLRQAAEIAGALVCSEIELSNFFDEQYSFTERQAEWMKNNIAAVLTKAADVAVNKVKNFEKEHEEFVGRVVIQEMTKISEKTMQEIGKSINRGALLAMQAVQATAKNEDRDEVLMWKSKHTGDITIPTRGVFISTNCVERIKKDINFRDVECVTTEVL